jgi:hypothetical protein
MVYTDLYRITAVPSVILVNLMAGMLSERGYVEKFQKKNGVVFGNLVCND